MKNKDTAGVLEGLKALGKSRLPMALAVRMGNCRRALEDHMVEQESAQNKLVDHHKGDAEELTSAHPNWLSFLEELNAYMGEEFICPETFSVYVRDEEFCWTEDFSTDVIGEGEILTQWIYELSPVLTFFYISESEKT